MACRSSSRLRCSSSHAIRASSQPFGAGLPGDCRHQAWHGGSWEPAKCWRSVRSVAGARPGGGSHAGRVDRSSLKQIPSIPGLLSPGYMFDLWVATALAARSRESPSCTSDASLSVRAASSTSAWYSECDAAMRSLKLTISATLEKAPCSYAEKMLSPPSRECPE